MKPPPLPQYALARSVAALLFWPVLMTSSGTLGLLGAYLMRHHVGVLIVVAAAVTALAAWLFASARHFRHRMDAPVAERSAMLAALLLGGAGCLPVGYVAFTAWRSSGTAVPVAIGIGVSGVVAAYVGFRWALRLPE